jgi:bacteriocin biosynthesis cyclodehydratase domain-containing protein
LKRSLQPFVAAGGSMYLLRSGAGDDYELGEVTAQDRAMVEVLAGGYVTRAGVHSALRERGIAGFGFEHGLAELERHGLVEREREVLAPRASERYDRQLIYFSDLADGHRSAEWMQARLAAATVVVLGCGGLGSWAASALACAGIGRLVLIDDDTVELSNLNRQVIYRERDVGEAKVVAAARALRAQNGELEVVAIRRRVRAPEDLDDVLGGADLLIATADWPPYELQRWVNEACARHGVAHVGAGQFPPLVRVGPLVVPGQTPCLACLELATERDFPVYRELSALRAARTPPAATLGAASALVGSMLAMDAIHLITGGSEPASLGRALTVDLRTMAVTREPVAFEAACAICAGAGADQSSRA